MRAQQHLNLFIVVVLAFACLSAAAHAASDNGGAIITRTDCALLATSGSDPRPVIGNVTCGFLDVPENWNAPGARRIRIAWAVLHADSRKPAPDPLVYLAGGPGGSALAEIATYSNLFAPIRKDRDILLFDQRGAAFSSPLRCNDWTMDQLFDLSIEGLLEPQAGEVAADLALPADTDANRLLDIARKDLGPVSERCAKQFTGAGIDLAMYTSAANARDTIALIEALGYPEYNLYGISYGTRLALTIARDFPESGIRSMVLDSVFPPQIDSFEQYPSELPEVAAQLFADCRRDAPCARWYPNLHARFAALLPALEAAPVSSRYGPIRSREIVAVISDLSVNVEAAPFIPRMVSELEHGETRTYEAIVSGEYLGLLPPQPLDSGTTGDAALDAIRAQIIVLASQLFSGDGPLSPAAQELVDQFTAQVSALPTDTAADLALRSIFLSRLPQTRQTLDQFIDRSFQGRSAAATNLKLRKAAKDLSDEDVAALFARLQSGTDSLDPYAYSLNPHLFSSVECNEEIPFEHLDVAVDVARAQSIPELAAPGLADAAAQFAICEKWPAPNVSPAENLPVHSDVPTLILAGSYDAQTPVTWGKSAFVTLPNATFVQAPMSGHGVLQYSGCAEKIAKAFLVAPDKDPATGCTSALRPRFVAPDGPLILPAQTIPAEAAATPVP